MDQSGRINKMDAILFAITLEVVLLQMRILEGSAELRASQWKSVSKTEKLQLEKLASDRYLARKSTYRSDAETSTSQSRRVTQNDSAEKETVKGTIRRTLIEVAESGEWSSLRDAVNTLVRRTSSALSKRADHEKLKCSCKDIAHELESKREQWALELQNADRKIALLQDKMRDDTLNANTRLCYAEKWLCARAESLELQHQEPRAPAPRSDLEQRAHDELVKAFQLQIKEREELLEHWRLRYADDIADMNERVSAKNLQVQITVARHDELQQLYDLHEGEMRGWLTFKRERAARLAREERQRMAATRMQAWWRGAMVRRALGSFRYLRNVKKSPSKSKKK